MQLRARASILYTLLGSGLMFAGFCLPWANSPLYPDIFSFRLLDLLLGAKPRASGADSPITWAFVAILFLLMIALLLLTLTQVLRPAPTVFRVGTMAILLLSIVLLGMLDLEWLNPNAALITPPYDALTAGIGQVVSGVGAVLIFLGIIRRPAPPRSKRVSIYES
ncbi:MAG TPA: hypothetical protein VFU60_05890 [Ktedonobacterales bacterium]|nr:hypothetical protein [Ktedonobacterales bacterium]